MQNANYLGTQQEICFFLLEPTPRTPSTNFPSSTLKKKQKCYLVIFSSRVKFLWLLFPTVGTAHHFITISDVILRSWRLAKKNSGIKKARRENTEKKNE